MLSKYPSQQSKLIATVISLSFLMQVAEGAHLRGLSEEEEEVSNRPPMITMVLGMLVMTGAVAKCAQSMRACCSYFFSKNRPDDETNLLGEPHAGYGSEQEASVPPNPANTPCDDGEEEQSDLTI